MDYFTNLQKVIDYIEQNLNENINLTKAIKESGYSIPHFYRVFNAVMGYSINQYIRKRRLSNAKFDLKNTNLKITEIAFNNGFESHEVFTRTFKNTYGVSPRDFRKISIELNLFEKINFLHEKNEPDLSLIKPEIVVKEKFLLLGIMNHVNRAEAIKYGLKLRTQAKFLPMIKNISNQKNPDVFYAVYDYAAENVLKADEDINFNYYCCVEISDITNIPSGMIVKTIPSSKYAVFYYNIKNDTLNDVNVGMPIYRYIDGVWLPNSGYEMTDNPSFEIVDISKNQVLYYISIK